MRVAFNTVLYRRGQLAAAIEQIAAAKYDGVELQPQHTLALAGDRTGLAEARAALERSGLAVSATMAGYLRDSETLNATLLAADVAAALNSSRLIVLPPRSEAGDLATFLSLLDRLADRCQQDGITIAVHHHAGTILDTPERIKSFIDAYSHPAVGICLDLAHYGLFADDEAAATERLAGSVSYVHVKDLAARPHEVGFAPTARSGQPWFRMPGDGTLALGEALTALREAGYDGWLSVEIENFTRPFDEALKSSIDVVRHMWADGTGASTRASRVPLKAAGDSLRIGLVGGGFAGVDLKAPSYREIAGVEVVAVADPSEEARARAVAALGLDGSAGFADFHELLESGRVDAIDISTPNLTHAEILLAAADASVSAICDKPLALTLAEADQVVGAYERSAAVGRVHRNFRYFPSWLRVFELLAEGAIGEPRSVVLSAMGIWAPGLTRADSGWRRLSSTAGGGIVIDYGIHLIYLARELLGGDQPSSVTATVDRVGVVEGDVEDRATIILDWPDGRQATLTLGWGSGSTGDCTVQGSDGALKPVFSGGHTAPHNVARGVAVLRGREDEEVHPLEWQRQPFTWYYRGSISHFAEAVRGESTTDATLRDGRADVEVALAAYESAAVGRTVELPLLPSDSVYQLGATGVHEIDGDQSAPIYRHALFAPSEAR